MDRKEIVSNHIVCSEKPSIELAMSQETEPEEVVNISCQDFKEVGEEKSSTVVSDACDQPRKDNSKVSTQFEDESLAELECKIDLAERNLQFLKENLEFELENCTSSSDLETKLSLDYGNFICDSMFIDNCIRSIGFPVFVIASVTCLFEKCSECRVEKHKVVSLSREVIQSITVEKVNVKFADAEIAHTRGVVWNVTSDCLNFVVSTDLSGNVTCLKILSIVSSVFDLLLGLVSPFILIGKQILQELCLSVLGWDIKVQLFIEDCKSSEDYQCQVMLDSKSFVLCVTCITTSRVIICVLALLTALTRLEQVLVKHLQFVWNPGPSTDSKSSTTAANLDVRDIVIVVENEATSNRSKMKRVAWVNSSRDQLVQGARVKIKTQNKLSTRTRSAV